MKNNTFDLETMSFSFEDVAIQNPTASPCGRFTVDPKGYGFYVENTGGGCTAWVKKLDNGYLVITNGNLGHDLGEDGKEFDMCFYDGSEDGDTDMWGHRIACTDLYVGVVPDELSLTPNGSTVDYATITKIINGVYDQISHRIDRDDALALVDLFKKIDLANT